jgi:Uri superfamily endonuclease
MIGPMSLERHARFHTEAATIPAFPGAYLLVIDLDRPVTAGVVAKRDALLAPGRYVYCGSAKGPGGLQARVARHMRRGKSVRWHIDRLTEQGRVVGAWVFPNGTECDLVAALSGWPIPVPGFGSSDCRTCASHLLAWPERMELPWAMAG